MVGMGEKPLDSTLTIDAGIHEAVMALQPASGATVEHPYPAAHEDAMTGMAFREPACNTEDEPGDYTPLRRRYAF
jgi:hypothetical protein